MFVQPLARPGCASEFSRPFGSLGLAAVLEMAARARSQPPCQKNGAQGAKAEAQSMTNDSLGPSWVQKKVSKNETIKRFSKTKLCSETPNMRSEIHSKSLKILLHQAILSADPVVPQGAPKVPKWSPSCKNASTRPTT